MLEIGPGPGRFTHRIGAESSRRVLVDLSEVMLRRAVTSPRDSDAERFAPDPVKGDGFRPPVRPDAFGEVTALGNVLGFAPEPFARSLQHLAGSVAPGGRLLLEIMPGTGERSRYLARLPPRALGRLLRSPVRGVRPRIEREGFAPVDGRTAKNHGFQRRTPADIVRALAPSGWTMEEAMAVAPALGLDPDRVAEVRPDPSAWARLLEIEEGLGRLPERWERSAAMMLAFERSGKNGRPRAR
ncbi:MAG: methyltransferase domain-containing protein [Thermoplasmata archaeon]